MANAYSVLGDSISTYDGMVPSGNAVYYEGELCEANGIAQLEDTWWMQTIAHAGGEFLANGSFSGSLVAGDAFPAGRTMERARQVLGPQGEAPDRILIYMGINDYGEGTPIQEFEAAYGELLANLQEVAPHAELLCLTLLPGRSEEHDVAFFRNKYKGSDLGAYNDAIRRWADACGAQVLDVAVAGEPFDTLDGTHPTARGMRQLASFAEEQMGIHG